MKLIAKAKRSGHMSYRRSRNSPFELRPSGTSICGTSRVIAIAKTPSVKAKILTDPCRAPAAADRSGHPARPRPNRSNRAGRSRDRAVPPSDRIRRSPSAG